MKNYSISRAVFIFGLSFILGLTACHVGYKAGVRQRVDSHLPVFEIVRVYDGDTFFVTFPDLPAVFGENLGIRINGIDTPELRTSSKHEKFLAEQAKQTLAEFLYNAKSIELRNVKRGKYFRLVADVIVDNEEVADKLIEYGLAVPYDGGTKTKDWSQESEVIE